MAHKCRMPLVPSADKPISLAQSPRSSSTRSYRVCHITCSHYASNTYTEHELNYNRASSASLYRAVPCVSSFASMLAKHHQCQLASPPPQEAPPPCIDTRSGIPILDASSAPAHTHLRTTTHLAKANTGYHGDPHQTASKIGHYNALYGVVL